MTIASDFSLTAYGGLLKRFSEIGYRFCSFTDVRPAEADLILRHDIDMSLAAACEMAEFEAGLDVSSAYFVLVRSPLYNALSEENATLLERILSLGHAVGLHFDAAMYDSDIDALNRAAETECAVLEGFLGRRIELISLHRPHPVLLGYDEPIAGRTHSYQSMYFSDIGYCSDSRGGWHHGHPLDHAAVEKRRALQLLTHPIWWTGSPGKPEEKLGTYLETALKNLDEALAHECETHRTGMLRITTGEQD